MQDIQDTVHIDMQDTEHRICARMTRTFTSVEHGPLLGGSSQQQEAQVALPALRMYSNIINNICFPWYSILDRNRTILGFCNFCLICTANRSMDLKTPRFHQA